MIENKHITKNFSLYEFIKSPTATNLFIANIPNAYVISNITDIAVKVLQPVRDEFNSPIVIDSGYRCSRLNRALGGVSTSQHLTGSAADIRPLDNANIVALWSFVLKLIDNGTIKVSQAILYRKKRFIHLGLYTGKKLNQILYK